MTRNHPKPRHEKSNTTRGRGTPGSRSHGPYINQQQIKDKQNFQNLHKTVKSAAPKLGPDSVEPTKSRTPAIKSRNHALDIHSMQKRDKERPGKDLLKGTKFVRIPVTPGKDFRDDALAPESPLD